MKKIFRMALVFALAGTTLMYTGCSKDYSEDINRLDKDVSALGSELGTKYQDLLNQLNSAKTSLEAAYKAADKELEGNFDKKIAEINAAIAKKADAAEIEAAMDQLKKDLMAEAEELVKAAAALKQEVKDLLDEFYAKISNELRSLVFVPDFYYEGIEATAYSRADFQVYKLKALTNADENGFAKGAKTGATEDNVSKLGNKDPNYKYLDSKYYYNKGEEAVATFDLNPSSFDIAGAEWSLAGMTKLNVKAEAEDEDETWEPAFVKASKNEDGKLEVTYSISNPDEMHTRGFWDMWTEDLNLIQLSAKVGDKTITSDWATVVPNVESNVQLQFTEESGYTNLKNTANDAKNLSGDEISIRDWAYNSGALDLAKVIEITTKIYNRTFTYSIEEFQTKYPGFKYQFELVPYTDGTNNTQEDKYGVIEGTEFTPCYVDAAGNSKKIAKGTEEGSSAIGRKPIVLVTLNEPNGNVVAHGFFKIEIAREAPSVTEIAVKDFGKLPFLCSTTLTTKWSEFSASVLEALHTDYAQFHHDFTIEYNACTEEGCEWTAKFYVKDGDKYIKALGENNVPISFGTMTFRKDSEGNGVNDKFTWTFDKTEAANIDKYQNLYVLFKSGYNSVVAMKFSADIAEPLELTYGEINPSYWFDDVEAGVDNTVRANVKVPTTSDEKLTSFEKDLDDFFVGNEVKVTLKDESKEVYSKAWETITTYYTYKFAASQPVINGYPFVASADGTKLYVADYDATNKAFKKDAQGKYVADEGKHIASLTEGKLTYQTNDTAKKFLNLWGASETDAAKMLYANVDVIYTATQNGVDNCVVAKDTSDFHVRFLRPLSIVHKEKADTLKDAVAGGSAMYIGDLVNAMDWNKNGAASMWVKHKAGTKPFGETLDADGFYPTYAQSSNGAKIYWVYSYSVTAITVDKDNIQTNQTGEWKALKEVNNKAKAYVAEKANNAWSEHSGNISIELASENRYKTPIENLTKYFFVYENNQGVVKDFQLKVPVTITYAWGQLTEDVLIYVKATATN